MDKQTRRLLILVLAAVGIPFIIAGVLVSRLVPSLVADTAAQIGELDSLPVVALEDSPPGAQVLIEGRVSERNPTQHGPYVVYTSRECRGSGDEERCTEFTHKSPLLIELPDGLAQIENTTYNWLGTKRFSAKEGRVEYAGIKAGDAVLAVGVLTARKDPPRIEADFIALGTQASYIAELQEQAGFWRVFGAAFTVIGVVLVVLSLVVALRRR